MRFKAREGTAARRHAMAMRRASFLVVAISLLVGGCEAVNLLGGGESTGHPTSSATATSTSSTTQSVPAAKPSSLLPLLDKIGASSTAFEFDVLHIPAGSWDGYAQASGGSFLQCLVARGPRAARLAFSVGWQGRLFLQFDAPGWSAASLAPGGESVLRVDDQATMHVTLSGTDTLLWASLGVDPKFADTIANGKRLQITSGSNTVMFPLTDASIALPALYECLSTETVEKGNGAFNIYGLKLNSGEQARVRDAIVGLLHDRGFGDFVADTPKKTSQLYGSRVMMSGTAWNGHATVFASVFGARSDTKKALTEIVNDAARVCHGEVAARILRIEPFNTPGAPGDTFGRSSLLCQTPDSEFVLETLAVFTGRDVVALHAIVHDVADRKRVEADFDAMKAVIASGA